MTQYVALLRGINVGGKNIIKMADLRLCLQEDGFTDIATYIQSGNVLFSASQEPAKLAQKLSRALDNTFHYQAPIVLRSHQQMRAIVAQTPAGFGSDPTAYRYDVIFLKEPFTPVQAMAVISVKEGVDTAAAGPDVLYFSRLTSRATQSRLSRIVSLPAYQNMTIRNWNTTTKLLALMDERAQT